MRSTPKYGYQNCRLQAPDIKNPTSDTILQTSDKINDIIQTAEIKDSVSDEYQ
jgi:hypothetical protein